MLWGRDIGYGALDGFFARLGLPPDEGAEAQARLDAMLAG